MRQEVVGSGKVVEVLKFCIEEFEFYSMGNEKSLILRRRVVKLIFYFEFGVFGNLEDGIEMELDWRHRDQKSLFGR